MSSLRRRSVHSEPAADGLSGANAEVALVLWSGHLGGAQVFTAELSGALRRRGVNARIVFVRSSEGLAGRLAELEIPYEELGLGRGRHVVLHPRRFARLVAQAGRDCAILVSSGYLAASLRAGGYRRPVVAVEHGGLLQVDQLPFGRRMLRRIDRASGIWACDVEVAVSRYVLDELRARRHGRNLICIPNGIDLERFSPAANGRRRPESFTIGYAGRLITSKGIFDLIHAFAQMTAGADATLLIAGEGPQRSALEGLARSLGLSRKIRFLGRVSDMPALWRMCDVGAAPSAGWVESFCLAAVEAMACGIPVVASRSGALPETVEDGVTGVLVDQGDIAGLARGFDRYAHDRSLRVAHGTNARRRCEHEYGLGKAASRYLQLVDSLIARGASTGTTA